MGRQKDPATAWALVAVYGVHPVEAETVNYVIQRADLFVALGLVAALALYQRGWRLLYLVPFVLASLSKPSALVFPVLLGLYLWLFEEPRWTRACLRTLPALVVGLCLAGLNLVMTPAGYRFGGMDPTGYRLTQPYVAWTYLESFVAPLWLSADSDLTVCQSLWEPRVLGGFACVVLLVGLAVMASRRPSGRPLAFGLGWFLVTLLPTSLAPLAEVTNDHRMFVPYVGLTLAVGTGFLGLVRGRRLRAACLALALLGLSLGTLERNRVWRSEDTLWADVVQKSPKNGRGWMNYGLTRMAQGDNSAALKAFQEAQRFNPNYVSLEVNLGIVLGAMHRESEAELHFQRAMKLENGTGVAGAYYGRYLVQHQRGAEAVSVLLQAHQQSPSAAEPRNLLLQQYRQAGRWAEALALLEECRGLDPHDADLAREQSQVQGQERAEIQRLEALPARPENLLELSFAYHRSGRFADCLRAAQRALELKPDYAEAYTNLSAAYLALHRWDEAIATAQKALELKPDFTLARNNLNYAQQQKKSSSGP